MAQLGDDTAKPSVHDHVAVLVEPAVHVGLATLTNSLARNGFCGTVWVGCRGALPAFAAGAHDVVVTPSCSLRFLPLTTKRPFTYFKAEFLELLWRDHCPTAESLCYFDTDVVVHRDWAFFRAWLAHGVALCEDHPYYSVSFTSPIRSAWADLMALEGIRPVREVDRYFNAGFVGVPRAERSFLKTWSRLASLVERSHSLSAGQPQPYVTGSLDSAAPVDVPPNIADLLRFYFVHDQDGLNMAIMASDNPISTLGSDGMGFTPTFNFAMTHSVGPLKPWNKPYIRHTLRSGSPPTPGDALWWSYADGPLTFVSRRQIEMATKRITVAKVLWRLVGGRS